MSYEQQVYNTMRTAIGRRAYARYIILRQLRTQGVSPSHVPCGELARVIRNLEAKWSAK